MRSTFVAPALVLITSLASSSLALTALTGSPCAAQCGNNLASTTGADMVCDDSDYSSASSYGATGSVFQGCVSCQLSSTYQDPVTKQTDLQWGLYNLRYAVSWCLFGYPNNPNAGSTPCTTSTACGPLGSMFEYDSLSLNASQYAYCTAINNYQVPKCNACLSNVQNQYYLTNFVTALYAGCEQQPTAGNTIAIQGSLFSKTATNITSPTTAPASSYTPNSSGLTLGAKIGIAVGCVVLFLGLTGFCIVWHGKRRRRNYLRKHQQRTGYADWLAQQEEAAKRAGTPKVDMESSGQFFDSPQSQRPLVPGLPWGVPQREDESPASALGEKAYFSPYSSQYNSPVSATDQIQISQAWPIDRKENFGSNVRSRSREKRFPRLGDEDETFGDRIELQNVAPVLMQPKRHARTGSGLTEEDAKKGDAV